MTSTLPRTLSALLLGVALSGCSSSESPASRAADDPVVADASPDAPPADVPVSGLDATPTEDAASADAAYCAAPGEPTAPDDRFITFDPPTYDDAFDPVFEGVEPGPAGTVAATFLLAPILYVAPTSAAFMCNHEQYRVDRCASRPGQLQTLNARLDGEVLSFTLASLNGSVNQNYVIGDETYTSVNLVNTQASGEVTTLTLDRDASGTETLARASSLGSSVTIVENADCSGSYTGIGDLPGESIEFSWTSPKANNVEFDYTVCEVATGCVSGTLP